MNRLLGFPRPRAARNFRNFDCLTFYALQISELKHDTLHCVRLTVKYLFQLSRNHAMIFFSINVHQIQFFIQFSIDGIFFHGIRLDRKSAIYPKIVYKVKVKQISLGNLMT